MSFIVLLLDINFIWCPNLFLGHIRGMKHITAKKNQIKSEVHTRNEKYMQVTYTLLTLLSSN